MFISLLSIQGPGKGSWPTSCSKEDQVWSQTRLRSMVKVSEGGDQIGDSCVSMKISLAPTATAKNVTVFYLGGIVASRDCWYRYLRTTLHFPRKIITTRTAKSRHLKTEWWLFPWLGTGNNIHLSFVFKT